MSLTFCSPMRRPLRAALHVGRVLRQRADAGDGEVILELVDILVAVRIDVVDDVVHGLILTLRRSGGQEIRRSGDKGIKKIRRSNF
jgi:hypothetical protein